MTQREGRSGQKGFVSEGGLERLRSRKNDGAPFRKNR